MNKPSMKVFCLKLITTLLTTIILSACSSGLVPIDAPTKQLQNLDDYDSDGVIEAREQCADTLLGAAIDNYGCGKKSPVIEPFKVNIKFANDSFVVPNEATPKIEELANFLKKYTDVHLLIEGHTSKVGTQHYNQVLSEKRAKAVVAILVRDYDIPTERVSAIGYGFDRPEDERETPEAHAANRRIMAELSLTTEVNEMEWTIYSVDQTL